MPTVETGVLTTGLLPETLRIYYERVLMQVLRAQAIYKQFVPMTYDANAVKAKQITFSEIFDLAPAIGTLDEAVPFVTGAYLDGDSVSIYISEHGNTVKTNTFHNTVAFLRSPDFEAVVREKIGQNLVDSLDIMARNAFLTTTNIHYSEAGSGSAPTSRATIAADDIFVPDYASQSKTNMESRNALGMDGNGTVACILHPRQGRDVKKSTGSDWTDKMKYAAPVRFLNGEIGEYDGIRFNKSTRAKLANAGATIAQTTLSEASVVGQGGPGSTAKSKLAYVKVEATTSFAAGQEISVHAAASGAYPLETDVTKEERVILTVDTDNKRLYLDRPLQIAHAQGAYVTEGRDIYATVMVGGPGVVYGVGLLPQVIVPPVIDDYARIQRVSWYGIFDFSCYRSQNIEVWYSAASTADHEYH